MAAKIFVTGASGTIGSELIAALIAQGHEVVAWQRGTPIFLEGVDIVINLAGSPIAEGRWTADRKEEILQSRIETTKKIVDAIAACKIPPRLFLSTSAIGFYGNTGDKAVTENAPQGTGFLADVCLKWEHEALQAKKLDVRVVLMRFGIVLTPKGGMLKKLLPIFRLGLGGKLGSGDAWMSWISIKDVVSAILWCIATPSINGPVNFSSPNPVTNKEFTKILAGAVHKPAWFTVPAWLLRLVFGQMADETMLSSVKVLPEVLLNSGFEFKDKSLIQVNVT